MSSSGSEEIKRWLVEMRSVNLTGLLLVPCRPFQVHLLDSGFLSVALNLLPLWSVFYSSPYLSVSPLVSVVCVFRSLATDNRLPCRFMFIWSVDSLPWPLEVAFSTSFSSLDSLLTLHMWRWRLEILISLLLDTSPTGCGKRHSAVNLKRPVPTEDQWREISVFYWQLFVAINNLRVWDTQVTRLQTAGPVLQFSTGWRWRLRRSRGGVWNWVIKIINVRWIICGQ